MSILVFLVRTSNILFMHYIRYFLGNLVHFLLILIFSFFAWETPVPMLIDPDVGLLLIRIIEGYPAPVVHP